MQTFLTVAPGEITLAAESIFLNAARHRFLFLHITIDVHYVLEMLLHDLMLDFLMVRFSFNDLGLAGCIVLTSTNLSVVRFAESLGGHIFLY